MKETWSNSLRRVLQRPATRWTVDVIGVLLILASLWLPPISLGERLFHTDYPTIGKQGGALTEPGGAILSIPEGALSKSLKVLFSVLAGEQTKDKATAAALQALPANLQPSALYSIRAYGPQPTKAGLILPIPDGANADLLDLYQWTGKTWQFTASTALASDRVVEAALDWLPKLLALVQAQTAPPVLTAHLAENAVVPTAHELSTFREIKIEDATLQSDGSIKIGKSIDASSVPTSCLLFSTLSNVSDGVVRADWINDLLGDEKLLATHISKTLSWLEGSQVAGLHLAYSGVSPDRREAFADFVDKLADRLYSQGKALSVQVDLPAQIAADQWDSGGYDWARLGNPVGALHVPVIADAAAYMQGGKMEALLRWATRQVDRNKIRLQVSTYSREIVGNQVSEKPYTKALAEAGQLALESKQTLVEGGASLPVQLPKLLESAGLCFDEASQSNWFSFRDEQGAERTIWLENASSLIRKLQLAAQFNLGGVALKNLLGEQNDGQIWAVLAQSQQAALASAPQASLSVVYTLKSASGESLGEVTKPLNDPKAILTAPKEPGKYVLAAAIVAPDGKGTPVPGGTVIIEIPTPTPTNTPTNTPTSTNTPTDTPTNTPTRTPTPVPPTNTPVPQPRIIVAPAASGFGYGIQADMVTDGNHSRILSHIQQIGFGWVKQQVEWFRYNPAPGAYDWAPLDRIVDSANAAGINVLFSVVKAPRWARPAGDTDEGPPSDPGTYATFIREMAARYKGRVKAYEIWNEQNLYYEWGGRGGKLNAARYVELLKLAYQAIKAVDPGAVVVSGALTPTGVNDGDIAIDDRVYLEQMYRAGLRNYCDAIGAHPSGYNNPPDADWRSYQDPSTGFKAVGHPSWFFRGTMESYYNIMAAYGDAGKKIWITEFGWASVEGLGVPPARGYEYAADNTEIEQAQFIVRAYQIAKNWGFVGVMFLWNLNFGPVAGAHDEKAAFGIVRPDWSPRQAFAALQGMGK